MNCAIMIETPCVVHRFNVPVETNAIVPMVTIHFINIFWLGIKAFIWLFFSNRAVAESLFNILYINFIWINWGFEQNIF